MKIEQIDDAGNLVEKGAVSRPVHAVGKDVTVSVGPSIYEATERIKKLLWNHYAGNLHGSDVYWSWGAGRTDLELTEWWAFATEVPGYHLIVAGDDMLMIHTHFGDCKHWDRKHLTFFEGDLSQCDHTSKLDCLFAQYVTEQYLGVSEEVIRIQLANARAKLVVSLNAKSNETITVLRSYERNTGGTDTTFGNSCTSITAAMYALATSPLANSTSKCWCSYATRHGTDQITQEFQEAYERLGLSLKLKIFSPMGEGFVHCRLPTFLKGTWYPVTRTADAPIS